MPTDDKQTRWLTRAGSESESRVTAGLGVGVDHVRGVTSVVCMSVCLCVSSQSRHASLRHRDAPSSVDHERRLDSNLSRQRWASTRPRRLGRGLSSAARRALPETRAAETLDPTETEETETVRLDSPSPSPLPLPPLPLPLPLPW